MTNAGKWVGVLALSVFILAARPQTLCAQDSEAPTVQSDASAHGETRPAGRPGDHQGLWIGGGFVGFAGQNGSYNGRVEVGIPLLPRGRMALAVQLPLYVGGNMLWMRLAAAPSLLFEVVLFDAWGRLSIAIEAGAGGGIYPARGGSRGFAVLRSGWGARFAFPFGGFVQILPVGVSYEFHLFGSWLNYEFTSLLGYRF